MAQRTLTEFAARHPEARTALARWIEVVSRARWGSPAEVQAGLSACKVLNGERVRFEVQGGAYRLIASFDFRRQIAYIKFIGSHAEYDRIDALTVSQR